DARIDALFFLIGEKGATHRRPDAQDRHAPRGEHDGVDAFGSLAARQRGVATGLRRDSRQRPRLGENLEKVAAGDVHGADRAAWRGREVAQANEPRLLLEGQRPQEDRVQDAEDRAGATDSEGERQQCRGAERRVPSQGTPSEPQVEKQGVHRAAGKFHTFRAVAVDAHRQGLIGAPRIFPAAATSSFAALPAPTSCTGCWQPPVGARLQYQLQGVTAYASTGGINVDITAVPAEGGSAVAPEVFD